MSVCEGTKNSATVTPNCGIAAVEYIKELYNTAAVDNGLYKDPTDDHNIRYTGASPKNYVLYNNELWRIIGIFKVSNGETSSDRVKLIRNESIGNYSWDSSASAVNTVAAWGVNNWVISDLNLLLNTAYYNQGTSTTCYNGQNNAHTSCDFSSTSSIKGLDETSKT